MKKATLIFAALAIMFMANVNLSACPDGWTDSGIKTIVYNGCTYEYSYCYGLLYGIHSISLSFINVLPPCTYLDFENNAQEVTNAVLIAICTDPVIYTWAGYLTIPVCPDGFLCTFRIYDAICYNGWTIYTRKNKDGTYTVLWQMNKCDDLIRSCNETIFICWDEVNQKYQITREGIESGPDCEYPCHTNCE